MGSIDPPTPEEVNNTTEATADQKSGHLNNYMERLRYFAPLMGTIAVGITLGIIGTNIVSEIRINRIEERNAYLDQQVDTLRSQQVPPGVTVTGDATCPDEIDAPNPDLGITRRDEEPENPNQYHEPCLFRWDNPNGGEEVAVTCPEDFICTFGLTNARMIVIPGGTTPYELPVHWAILRYLTAYPPDENGNVAWQRNQCSVLRNEQQQFVKIKNDPNAPNGWIVIPVGFSCVSELG